MKDDILKSLKIKYKNLGFTDKAFEGVADFLAITVTEADQIETAVDGVKPLLTSFQGDVDLRVNQAVAKAKAPKGGEEQPNPAVETKPVDASDPLAQLTQLVTGLAQSVNSLVEKDKSQTLQSKWETLAEKNGVKNTKLIEKWMPSSEDDFDASITDLVEFNKDLVIEDSNASSTGRPAASTGGAASTEKAKHGAGILDKWAKANDPVGEEN